MDVPAPRARLDSWKEIAAYLNRSERTVRRWEEKEGLPVHRLHHDKRGSVYAYGDELDEWRESRRQLLNAEPPDAPSVPTPAPPLDDERFTLAQAQGHPPAARLWWVAAALSVLMTGSLVFFWPIRPALPSAAAGPPNPEAVRLVERGRFGANAGRTQIETGIGYYQDAIRVDPSYAPAWTALATAHLAIAWFGETPMTELAVQARREAQEGLRLDPSRGDGWQVLAMVSHFFEWEHATAEAQFRKAMVLSPQHAGVASWFGDFLADMGRLDEARAAYLHAQTLAPRWLEPYTFSANLHLLGGHPDLAIADYRRVLATDPGYGLGNHYLGRAYLAIGKRAEGVEHLRKSNQLLGDIPFSRADLASGLAAAGHRTEAETLLSAMMRQREQGYYPAFALAIVHLGLGNTDEAMDWLQRAADERHLGFFMPTADPAYDGVRAHPRYLKVMERIRIAPRGAGSPQTRR